MSYEIIRDALCIVVRDQGEYAAFYVRENKAKRNNDSDYYQCELTIHSSFGNVGHYWNAMSTPAAMFFDRTESDYILGKLFGDGARVQAKVLNFNFRYRSTEHFMQIFRDYYGPTHKAFASLDTNGQAALAHDVAVLLEELNVAGPSSLVVPAAYLEVVITKN